MLLRMVKVISLNKSPARDIPNRKEPLCQIPITDTEALRTAFSLKPVLPLVVAAIKHSTIKITITRISPQESWREVHRRRWMIMEPCCRNNSTRGGQRRTYSTSASKVHQ